MTARIDKKNATVAAIQRTGDRNKDGHAPVRIRVTYDRTQRYYPFIFNGKTLYLPEGELQNIMTTKNPRNERREIREAVNEAETRARDVIKKTTGNNRPFSFDQFENEFLHQKNSGFLGTFRAHLRELEDAGRIGTFQAYRNAFVAFNKFRGATYKRESRATKEIKPGRELNPIDLTPAVLKKFDTWMKDGGAGRNTVAMYARALKVVFNLCVDQNKSLAEFYPFAARQGDRRRYQIKTSSATKKGDVLSVEQIRQFINITTEPGLPEHEAKLLWLFSFYCQGANFRDIAYLKYNNINGDSITYIRRKTRDTEREEKPIEIPLTDSIREIIVVLGNPDKRKNSFVFQLLHPGMSPLLEDSTIKSKIKLTNKWLGRLCEVNELPKITTYWARHTYASLLKESGESVDVIRELLGHADAKTTEAYLRRFDLDKKRGINEGLMKIIKSA